MSEQELYLWNRTKELHALLNEVLESEFQKFKDTPTTQEEEQQQ